jgi:oxaloacetate decarboxylase beta subunit
MIGMPVCLFILQLEESLSRFSAAIAFGVLLANLPLAGLMAAPPDNSTEPGGLLYYLYMGVKKGIYPSLIFLGIGAMTDFGPLIARPSSLFLGAAAQLGIYVAFIVAIILGFSPRQQLP